MRVFLIFILTLFFIVQAKAQHVGACNVHTPRDMKAEPYDPAYCDFYQRQLAYREDTLKQNDLMRQRAENYAAPMREARAKYAQDLERLNAQRGGINAAAQDITPEEAELQMLIAEEEEQVLAP